MKVTVVTNARGKVVACVDGAASSPVKRNGITATIVPQTGQKFHEIEVPPSYADLEPLEFLKAVGKQVKR